WIKLDHYTVNQDAAVMKIDPGPAARAGLDRALRQPLGQVGRLGQHRPDRGPIMTFETALKGAHVTAVFTTLDGANHKSTLAHVCLCHFAYLKSPTLPASPIP